MQSSESISTIAVYDERPFFEKALVYGVMHVHANPHDHPP